MTAEEVLLRYSSEDLPEFVEINISSIETVGNFGNRPLHVACVRGALEEVEALLFAGADVNAHGERSNTPLHEAVGQGHESVVRCLLAHNANQTLRNDDGYSPLDIARISKRERIASLLEESHPR